MLPSTNSTREWIVDCGCTMTCTRPGGMSNKRQASITSNPLFINVAESMVILLPIFQVGWLSACCTVIEANSDLGVFRNGPPEAVSQMRSTSSMRPPRRHWSVSYTHLRAHETDSYLVCRLLLEKK